MKIWVRFGLKIFCREIAINDKFFLRSKGPLLLACNHPNSFLDAIIIGSQFDQPVHYLARGDAFRVPVARKWLKKLQLIPIYRLKEGREYLALNDASFDLCRQILLDGGILLIFSEGLCMNQWTLRPLKKGTARIALGAWTLPTMANEFRVVPVGLNYDSFDRLGKRVIIHFGDPITDIDRMTGTSEAEAIQDFNRILSTRLAEGILQSSNSDKWIQILISNHRLTGERNADLISVLKSKQTGEQSILVRSIIDKIRSPGIISGSAFSFILNASGLVLLLIPACAGFALHLPLFVPLRKFVKKKTSGTVFYDSVMFGSLLLIYPMYWLLLIGISLWINVNIYVRLIVLFMPLTGWTYLIWKDCWQRVYNYLVLSFRERAYLQKFLS